MTVFKLWLKVVGLFVLAIVFVGGCGIVTGVISLPFHAASATVDTAHGIIDKTLNADNALYNYEHFYDLYNDAKKQVVNIRAAQAAIEQMKRDYGADMTQWSKSQQEDYSLQQSNIQGYVQMYNSIVSRYNSDSEKANRALFKAHNLPETLPLDWHDFE
jgi:hypothetical protein